MIILTAAQADEVRGETTPGFMLDPVVLLDGTFVLPDAVLTDPAHEPKWGILAALPTREVADSEFVPAPLI